MATCKECLHVAVCGRCVATGGRVRDCEHFAGGSRWIPVTERLPKEEWERCSAEKDWDVFPCLAVVKHNNRSRYVDKLFFTGENFVDDEYVRYTEQVTQWMPLPEPPKEVE